MPVASRPARKYVHTPRASSKQPVEQSAPTPNVSAPGPGRPRPRRPRAPPRSHPPPPPAVTLKFGAVNIKQCKQAVASLCPYHCQSEAKFTTQASAHLGGGLALLLLLSLGAGGAEVGLPHRPGGRVRWGSKRVSVEERMDVARALAWQATACHTCAQPVCTSTCQPDHSGERWEQSSHPKLT